ncbi:PREDICTED: uncharacterized protein LOC109158655 [Ipomoea nil]|uniref:uncharacterized protein LOC109158655 n=1 Tax=Ipomoea nil TaxID=35883 RepID=UPI0009008CE1|nr:PREDICTED: uncharacterized protein LOC109158655 [Ipomoea nil]
MDLMGGSSDPPAAFQNSEKETRLTKPSVQEGDWSSEESRNSGKGNTMAMADSGASAATDNSGINGGDTSQKFANMPSLDETDCLSDVDDVDVCEYDRVCIPLFIL